MSHLFDRASLSERKQQHPTRPLYANPGALTETPTTTLPTYAPSSVGVDVVEGSRRPTTGVLTGPYANKPTTRPLVYIPATEKRPRTDKLAAKPRRSRIMIGACAGILLVALLAVFFVSPLNNGQQSFGLAQTINNWFTHQAPEVINPAQQYTTIPTPALTTGEGYCGGTDIWGTCATWITASGVMGTDQMQRPILGAVITQPFAHPEYQDWCGCWKPHSGIDLAAPFGSPIMAADSGQVIWTGWDWSGLGWAVKINHGHYIATIYGHMEKFIVHVGENVTKGQVIGYEGSTGQSTGPHVHFMVMVNNIWVNPQLYMQLP
ncbi:MAG TPA: M23 family metallopeptidase [Ktedonobacteraceae bacterium]|nr:M23 family metallopeptidase [Ktedonobacteraceae bacterium]